MTDESPEKAAEINRSGVLTPGDTVTVDVKTDGHDVELIPREPVSRRALELQHTDEDRLMAQLVEEPEQPVFSHPVVGKVQTSGSRMARIQSRNANRESLVWFEYTPHLQMAALDMPDGANGRIWVLKDTLESEYSCRECHGLGYDESIECEVCRGKQERDGVSCSACLVLGYGRKDKWACGRGKCHSCRGAGWRAGIVIPEVAQGAPVSGIVISLGPNTSVLKLGDRVLHSIYAGHSIKAPGGRELTVMRESEVLSLVREK